MAGTQRGGPAPSTRPRLRYDGRLDLDDLDAPLDLDDLDAPLDLDVIGSERDGPLLSERVGSLLESSGITPFVRRHRTAVTAGAVVAALLLGSAGWWWVSRPEPLPDAPLLLVKTSGPDRTQVALRPGNGTVLDLTLAVAVASVERPGVRVELLAVAGPGLVPPSVPSAALVDTSVTDSVATVSAGLDCTTAESGRPALVAQPADFGVVVRRTAPEGETRDERIRLVGAQRLAQVVRATCLQAAADRDLSTVRLTATPVDGQAAVDVDLTLADGGTRAWSALRTSIRALPRLVNARPAQDLAPGARVTVRSRLWLGDCADPSAALADGIVLRTDLTPDDAMPGAPDTAGNTFSVPVGPADRRVVDLAFARVCSSSRPVPTVTQAIMTHGGTDGTAGTLLSR